MLCYTLDCHSMSAFIAKLTACSARTDTNLNEATDTNNFYQAYVNTPLVVGVDVGAAALAPDVAMWNNAIAWAEERESERKAAAAAAAATATTELFNSWIEMEPAIVALAADVVPEFAVGEILTAMNVAMTEVGGGGMVSKTTLIAAATKGVDRVMSLREVFAVEKAMSDEITATARAANIAELRALVFAMRATVSAA